LRNPIIQKPQRKNGWAWLKGIKRDATETTPSSQVIQYETFNAQATWNS